jgi:hypothetical protein
MDSGPFKYGLPADFVAAVDAIAGRASETILR